jgi:hypothetical protein
VTNRKKKDQVRVQRATGKWYGGLLLQHQRSVGLSMLVVRYDRMIKVSVQTTPKGGPGYSHPKNGLVKSNNLRLPVLHEDVCSFSLDNDRSGEYDSPRYSERGILIAILDSDWHKKIVTL